MSEHLPMTLADLQVAIDVGNDTAIRAFYQACEVESGNDRLLAYGKELNFPTAVVQETPANGRRIMLGRDLTKVLHASTNIGPTSRLLKRHSIELLSINGFNQIGQIALRDLFNLEGFDHKTTFATYAHFLIVAMHGRTEKARKVRARILQAEAGERTREKVRETTGLHPEDLEKELRGSKEDPVLAQLMYVMRQKQLQHDEDITQLKESDVSRQQRQDALEQENQRLQAQLDAQQTEIKRTSHLANQAMDEADDGMTLEEFIDRHDLYRQMPRPYWEHVYPNWLKNYSLENNLKIRDKRVWGKRWKYEKRYKVRALLALQEEVLHRPTQFRLFFGHDD